LRVFIAAPVFDGLKESFQSTTSARSRGPNCVVPPVPRTGGLPKPETGAAITQRGGQPRRRAIGLAIAATANVHRVPLLSADDGDFEVIGDLVEVSLFDSSQP
jgi:hypothetical protein